MQPLGRLDRPALTPSLAFYPASCPPFTHLPWGSETLALAGFDEASIATNQRI